MPPLPPLPVPLEWLVVSIGNPAPYANSMHSAGHFALRALASHARQFRAAGPDEPKLAFAESSSYMNLSGPSVRKAWKKRLGTSGCQPSELGLIVLHDELSLKYGAIQERPWGSSARGHNGLKSISESMGATKFPNMPWWRIGVGINRPASRSPGDVADYVLKDINPALLDRINSVTGPDLYTHIKNLQNKLQLQADTNQP